MEKDLIHAFEDIDGELPNTLIKKCLDICHEFDLQHSELVSKWDALKYAKKESSDVVKEEQLNELREQLAAKREKQGAKGLQRAALAHSAAPVKTLSKASLEMLENTEADPFKAVFGVSLSNYGTSTLSPEKQARKRPSGDAGLMTPEPRKRVSILSPSVDSSPISQSQEDSGAVVCSFNSTEVARAIGSEKDVARRTKIEVIGPTSGSSMRYMFEDIEEKRESLNALIENMGKLIAAANKPNAEEKVAKVEEEESKTASEEKKDEDEATEQALVYSPVGVPNQSSVVVCGRIAGEGGAKLTVNGIYLCGDRVLSNGAITKLRAGQLKSYSFFPGQLMALKGINSSGTGMVVEELLKPAILPKSSLLPDTVTRVNYGLNGDPLSILVAVGPFTAGINLAYAPLNELLSQAQLLKPDVLILMGPFLDVNHMDVKTGKMQQSFQEFVHSLLRDIIERTHELGTKILIVPSCDDAQWENALPQRPAEFLYELPDSDRVMRLSNPATVRINDVTFGLANNDVILQLGKVELAVNKEGDRLKRLASYLVKQQSYYPIFPPADGDSVEYGHLDRLLFPGVTPDILITPSKFLKYFAINLGNDVLCVNPATLAKGSTGGTYAHISIHPRKDEEIIDENGFITKHFIASRTRVDIIRV